MIGFVYNWFVPKTTWFSLKVNECVLNRTGLVVNKTGCVLDSTGFDLNIPKIVLVLINWINILMELSEVPLDLFYTLVN